MKKLFPLSGIITVLNTPFSQSGEIDYQALKRNVKEALAAGIAGFLLPAMASEVHHLSLMEKLKSLETVLDLVDGRVPVFGGTAAESVTRSGELIKAYQDLGCRHFLVQLPYHSEERFKAEFYRLMELGPEIVMLQDWSSDTYGLPDELIMELFERVPAFRCLKVETVPAGIKYTKMLELSNGTMHISGGWAVMQMPEALKRGVHAFMPTAMHWIYTRIFDLYRDGAHEAAIALFHEVLPVLAFSNQHLDISIHFFKRLLWRQGIYPTSKVRIKTSVFDQVHQDISDTLIDRVMQIEKRFKADHN